MIIAGSQLNLVHSIDILNDRIRDRLDICGRALVGLSITRRLTRVTDRQCLVWFDYQRKSCSFHTEVAYRYIVDITVTTQQGYVIHNERAQYILARYGDEYVDCWNVGGDTEIRTVPSAVAISDRAVLCESVFDANAYLTDGDERLEDLIDEIKECKSCPETCGPIGYPCHQSAVDITSDVS